MVINGLTLPVGGTTKESSTCLCLVIFVMGLYHFYLITSLMDASLVLGQSYDCPNISEATMKSAG